MVLSELTEMEEMTSPTSVISQLAFFSDTPAGIPSSRNILKEPIRFFSSALYAARTFVMLRGREDGSNGVAWATFGQYRLIASFSHITNDNIIGIGQTHSLSRALPMTLTSHASRGLCHSPWLHHWPLLFDDDGLREIDSSCEARRYIVSVEQRGMDC